jgi:outer membrane lipoprotein-sorting protein
MRPADKTRQFIKNASIKSNPEVNEAVLKELLNELDQSKSKPCAARELNIWRIIMKSPITKIATAAVILVSVVAGIYFLGVPTESVAWADVVRPILTARTVVFNVEGENIPKTRLMNMGTQRVRGEVLSPDGKTVQVIILDYDTFRMLQLIPSKKKAVVIDLKDLPEEPENVLEELRNVVTEIQNDPEISVEPLGEKEIDDRIATGFRARNPDGEFTVWADPETALPIRIEQQWRQMQFVYTDFQFDIEMDESLFSMEIPEGYSELPSGELRIASSTEKDLVETLRIWAEVILDDAFPEDLSAQVYVDDVKKNLKKFANLQEKEKMELAMKLGPGFIFVQLLKAENDWRYVGKNVKLGDSESPVCWYRPEGSETYRVIYGDLSVKDVAAGDLPK